MHNPIDRIAHTTAFVTPVVEHWLERDSKRGKHHTYLPFGPAAAIASSASLAVVASSYQN